MKKRIDIKYHFKCLCLNDFSLPVAFTVGTLRQQLGHMWCQDEPSGRQMEFRYYLKTGCVSLSQCLKLIADYEFYDNTLK
jgi:hypothetical protein